MYAISPLDPDTVRRYVHLAPFEVREVLHAFAALPTLSVLGASIMGRPIGLAVVARESEAWTSLAAADGKPGARLLALTVARQYRRIGVGRALLEAAQRRLGAQGVQQISCAYSFDTAEGTAAAEAFFAATGWSAPETTMVHCAADESFMNAPLLRDLPPLPPEYEVCDWVDLTPAERNSIRDRQAKEPWYPEALDPFHFEAELEVVNSLALKYHGEVVGWLLTTRTSPKTMYYRCLFVREDLARLGRGLTLLVEAINRHWEEIGHQPGLGEWSTPASLPRMIRFIRRHLEPHGAKVREQRRVRVDITTDAPARTLVRTTAALTSVRHVPLLSVVEVRALREELLETRNRWRARRDSLAFHTLGAVACLDALDDIETYERFARLDNAYLRGRFPVLYERLLDVLTEALGAPACYHPDWALPGFRIMHPQRGATLPLGAIRPDVHHFALSDTPVSRADCVAFSLCISDHDHRSGYTLWSLAHSDTIGLDSEEIARLLDASERVECTHEPLSLLIRRGDVYAQRLPLSQHAQEQITLEGNAFYDQGRWAVYSK